MKSFLTILALSTLSYTSFAKTLEVVVPAGKNVVEFSSSVSHSGCSNKTYFLDVIKTNDGYSAGNNIAIKEDGEVWEDVMPAIQPYPGRGRVTCMAYITTTTKVKFKHTAFEAETIKVQIPDSMTVGLDVKITEVKLAH